MSEPVLTIVVPAYNMDAYLEDCLESIAHSASIDLLEVLVVDDGGTDSSLTIAQSFEQRFPDSFRAIHKDNGGHGSVINFGIAQARGTYLKVVDGDDRVDPAALDALINVLSSTPADLVLSDYAIMDDKTEQLVEHRHAAADPTHYGTVQPISIMGYETIAKIHALTIRTALLRENDLRVDEGCFYEDAEFSIYPLAHAKTVFFDEHLVYHYRVGRMGQSVDVERLARNSDQHLNVMASLLAFRDAHADLEVDALRAIDRAIAYYTQNQYQIFLSLGNTPEVRAALRSFDELLKVDYPAVYDAAEKRSIWAIRKSKYRMFALGCLAYKLYRTFK